MSRAQLAETANGRAPCRTRAVPPPITPPRSITLVLLHRLTLVLRDGRLRGDVDQGLCNQPALVGLDQGVAGDDGGRLPHLNQHIHLRQQIPGREDRQQSKKKAGKTSAGHGAGWARQTASAGRRRAGIQAAQRRQLADQQRPPPPTHTSHVPRPPTHLLQAWLHGEHGANGDASDAHRRANSDAAGHRELQDRLVALQAGRQAGGQEGHGGVGRGAGRWHLLAAAAVQLSKPGGRGWGCLPACMRRQQAARGAHLTAPAQLPALRPRNHHERKPCSGRGGESKACSSVRLEAGGRGAAVNGWLG